MSGPTGDKRRFFRGAPSQRIVIEDVVAKREIGQLVNLSEAGFMVLGDMTVDIGNNYQFTLHFPTAVEARTELNLSAECLWSMETNGGGQYWSGFSVTGLTDEKKQLFRKLQLN